MSNRLANASSPYLRMHAGNPVHWQPWDDAALARARATDTPILLSIGYSACHWCHVMAHECFEDAAIADLMNRTFVNIKLDREERPDIDHIYQLAHQALSGRGGGWPLTAFLDPQDLAPFYMGTYFPPTPRHGLPAFPEVLRGVREYFDGHRAELGARAAELRDWLQRAQGGAGDGTLDVERAGGLARQRLASAYDPEWGGRRGAPKFPRPAELEWLLDREGDAHARSMAQRTLDMMARRGLQDHLGGGFFRYCVDARWSIPHFEKMLYDNAQLLPVYARAAIALDADPASRTLARDAVHGIVAWLCRDMTAPDGVFYSAVDADSADGEGAFYLWTREEMHAALPEDLHELAARACGFDRPPNFEGRAWHLLRAAAPDDDAALAARAPAASVTDYDTVRTALFDAREQREHPLRDDKILTAWNALAIAGLARAGRMLDDASCTEMARRALDALHGSVWIDGELYANAAAAPARIPGFLDDHAFVLDALLETLQLAFVRRDLDWAIALADRLCERFADRDAGGFWFSTAQHATPLARNRSWTDDALPNGNGVAIGSLLRLGHLVGEARYLEAAERALRAAGGALQQFPEACPTLLRAAAEFAQPRMQVVVRTGSEMQSRWRTAIAGGLRDAGIGPDASNVDVFLIPADGDAWPGLLATRTVRGDAGTCWVCAGLTCQAPVTTPAALPAALRMAAGTVSGRQPRAP